MKIINGIEVNVKNGELSVEEIIEYITQIQETNKGEKLISLTLTIDGDYIDAEYQFANVQFERIRRITGYLTGTIEKWNNAKRAELNDRVKHS